MSKFLLNEEEKNDIRTMYESMGIFLNEENIYGTLARKAVAWAGKNEDDIIKLFKTTEVALAKSIDDIVSLATKSKSLTQLDDLQAKLMHFYNPSGQVATVEAAKKNVVKFLNGYSKSKGKTNWKVVRDEVSGTAPKPQAPAQASAKPNADYVQVRQNPVGGIFGNKLSGNRISNGSFTNVINDIDPSKITNWGGSIDNYNKIIANAIKTGNYEKVSRGGFEKLGITDFREFLKNNIAKINEVIPESGRWSVNFK
jgi:hypothetical protein